MSNKPQLLKALVDYEAKQNGGNKLNASLCAFQKRLEYDFDVLLQKIWDAQSNQKASDEIGINPPNNPETNEPYKNSRTILAWKQRAQLIRSLRTRFGDKALNVIKEFIKDLRK